MENGAFSTFGVILVARTTLPALATTCAQKTNGALDTYLNGVPCGIVTRSSVSLSLHVEYGVITSRHAQRYI
jgi:hypothetical protein